MKNLHGYRISCYGMSAYTKLFLCEDVFDALMMFSEIFDINYTKLATLQKDQLLEVKRLNVIAVPYEALTLEEMDYISNSYHVFCDAGDRVVRLIEK